MKILVIEDSPEIIEAISLCFQLRWPEASVVAIFGDSAFFHTSIPAICNAAHNQSNILMVVLDNKATATSGFQPHPGVARDAMGRNAPALDIAQIAQACGVKNVYTVESDKIDLTLMDMFKKALSQNDLTLIIVRMRTRE